MADSEDRRVAKALLGLGMSKDDVRAAMQKMAAEQDVMVVTEDGATEPAPAGVGLFDDDDKGQ